MLSEKGLGKTYETYKKSPNAERKANGMRDLARFTETVRDMVSALEAGKALGLSPDRYGRCACPVHHGTDRNCKLWKDNLGWYCYVCKTGGDVIRLVERVNQCSFPDAVEWLNSAFQLGLPLDGQDSPERRKDAEIAKKRRQIERELRKAVRDEVFETYLNAGDLVGRMELDMDTYRPVRWDEEWDERFVAALRYLPEARELAADAGMATIGAKT